MGTGFSDIAKQGKDDGTALQRQHRLGPNRQFTYVYRRGKRAACKDLSLLFVKSGQAKFLLALPVKKVWKTGRAKALFFSFYRQKILLRI